MLVEKLRDGLVLAGTARRIFGLWDTELATGQGVRPHLHEEFEEVYYILSGRGRVRIGREEHEVTEGDVVYIPPGEVHTILCTSPGALRFITVTVALKNETQGLEEVPYIG
jgi:mannose-6-phosphate isomerase-like protein (cupin superfamily)